MRSRKLTSIALSVALAGCSLAYDGSRFQGGTGTDTGAADTGAPIDSGMPIDTGMPDTGADGGTPADVGVDAPVTGCSTEAECATPGQYCNLTTHSCMAGCNDAADCAATGGGVCDGGSHSCSCTGDADCAVDNYCHGTMCSRCDNDSDGYYAEGAAALRCSRGAHVQGHDCDDGNPQIHPFARADCTTLAVIESCTLPFTLAPAGITVQEVGLTDTHVLWGESGGGVRATSGHLGMVVGDDSPQLPSGAQNGFVAWIGSTGSPAYYGVPLRFEGSPDTPDTLFSAFPVGDAAIGNNIGDMSSVMGMSIVGTAGGTMVAYWQALRGHPAATYTAPPTSGFMGSLYTPATAVGEWVSHGSGAMIVDGGMGPQIMNITPATGHVTGPANVRAGTWLAGAGSAYMWVADDTHVGIWNGADTGISPPTVDLGAYTRTMPTPELVHPNFRGSIASARANDGMGTELFLAAVPIGSTATPPTGRMALLRWQYVRPTASTDRTDATIPAQVYLSELNLGVRFNPAAGVSIVTADAQTAFITYQENGAVVLRPLSMTPPTGRPPREDPPTLAMIDLGTADALGVIDAVGLTMADPRFPTGAVGRVAVGAMVTAPGGHELRVRALEACIVP